MFWGSSFGTIVYLCVALLCLFVSFLFLRWTHSSFVSGGSSFGTLVKPRFLQSTVPENYHDDDDAVDDYDDDDDISWIHVSQILVNG